MNRHVQQLALLAGLVLVFFWDGVFGDRVMCMRDTAGIFIPWHQLSGQAFADGALPLWNHYSNCGEPLLANLQVAAYYPPSFLFYVLPVVLALKLWLIFHLIVSAWGTYGLLRHWRLKSAPAVLGALTFTFSTYVIARMEFQSCFGALVWSPLLLLTASRVVERLRDLRGSSYLDLLRGVSSRVAPLALVMGLQFLAGYPQQLIFGLILAFAYAIARCLAWRDPRSAALAVGAIFLAGGGALFLGACQLLPSMELLPHSVRGESFDAAQSSASLHPRLLLSWLLPFLAGRPGYDGSWWGGQGLTVFELWVGTGYVGVLPLALASFAPLTLKAKRYRFLTGFFLLTVIAGFFLALGRYTPAYELFCTYAPFFDRLRFPSKSLVYVVIGLSVLAALGLQHLLEIREWGRGEYGVVYAWAVVALVFACAYALAKPSLFETLTGGAYADSPSRPDRYASLLDDLGMAVVFLLVNAVVLFALARALPRKRKALAGLVVGLAFANLFLVSRQLHPRTTGSVYSYASPQIRQLAAEGGRVALPYYRWGQQLLYGIGREDVYRFAKDAGIGDTSLPLRVSKVKGGAGLVIARTKRFTDPAHLLEPGDPVRERVRDLLSVSIELQGPPLEVALGNPATASIRGVRRSTALARAFLVRRWEVAKDTDAAERILLSPAFNPRTTAVLATSPGIKQGNGPAGEVLTVDYGWNSVDLTLRVNAPAVLVLTDTDFPGWEATLDGRPTPILRANAHFRAIVVQPGVRRVSMRYDPWPAKVGLILSCLTLPLLLAGWFFGHLSGRIVRGEVRKTVVEDDSTIGDRRP